MNIALGDVLALSMDLLAIGNRFGDSEAVRSVMVAIASGKDVGVGSMLIVVGFLYRIREQSEISPASRRAVEAVIRACIRKQTRRPTRAAKQ